MSQEILCRCGKSFRLIPAGISKRYGRPYAAFYTCGNKSCETSMPASEMERLIASGATSLPDTVKSKGRRNWTPKKQRSPRQLTGNPKAPYVPHRRMTDEQEAWISAMLTGSTSTVYESAADAGTGKSTMIVQLAGRAKLRPRESVAGVVVTFGKKASEDTKSRLPYHWVGATIHSIGNEFVCAYYGTEKRGINEYKTQDILSDEYPDEGALYTVVDKLVELAKSQAWTERDATDERIEERATFYNVDIGDNPAQAFTMTRNVLKISRTQIRRYGHNFDDQVWLPVVNDIPIVTYRYVVGDEWQDCSIARILLAMKICGGTFGYVGDKDQAIFGFTFADVTSMETCARLAQEIMHRQITSYQLTMNWRCPTDAIGLVQCIHPSIRARPGAPKGAVHVINHDQFVKEVRIGDLVLCRINADLIRAGYALIKAGIPAVVLGRDIAAKLKGIIVRFGMNDDETYVTTRTLVTRLNEWFENEMAGIDEKNLRNPAKYITDLEDEYYCILALCGIVVYDDDRDPDWSGVLPHVKAVLDKIDEMFGEDGEHDDSKVVTLATVHKMKGGQRARVHLLRADELHPHPLASCEWELIQEMCILYVAITRCGDGTDNPDQKLFFVGDMPQVLKDADGERWLTEYVDTYIIEEEDNATTN